MECVRGFVEFVRSEAGLATCRDREGRVLQLGTTQTSPTTIELLKGVVGALVVTRDQKLRTQSTYLFSRYNSLVVVGGACIITKKSHPSLHSF